MIPSLFTLGLALGPLWWVYPRTRDDVIHLSLWVNCLFFLSLSLLTAPWPLQVIVLLGVLGIAHKHLR